jgi:CheY-like chemotaxis protein
MACVLIVEDNRDLRDLMEVLLKSSGYETMTAENGAVGLEMMHRRLPCTVLLDLMMPVMDGFTFRKCQLADPELAAVPIICVTAMFDPQEVERRLDARCLPKPLDFDQLLSMVSGMCAEEKPH